MIFYDIVDHCEDGTETTHQDAFVMSNKVGNIMSETTKVWDIMMHCNGVSTTWEIMKYVK